VFGSAEERRARRYPSREDPRTTFQRDRDRVLYNGAFRRLAGVTQIVHAAEGHAFHNRLTHSIKVAQVARRTTEYLLAGSPTELAESLGLDADVAETAALIHDLGHPPFGHIAEDELAACFQRLEVTDGFEGNAHSFRIVTNLAVRQGDHPGLNLTRATLAAVLKYPWARGANGPKSDKKWGYFPSELEDFKFARQFYGAADQNKSLEAEIMDWADDVTYSIHDLDDSYRSGLIPLDRLLRDKDHRARFIDWCMQHWAAEHVQAPLTSADANEVFELIAFMSGQSSTSPLSEPYVGLVSQRRVLDRVASTFLRRYLYGEEGEPRPLQLVNSPGQKRLQINAQIEAEVRLLKQLMHYYVYENPALAGQQFGQRAVIRRLFEAFYDALDSKAESRGIIPHAFRDAAHERASSVTERARLAADIVGSLTEQEALLLDGRLTGARPGSVLDHIVR
jgi:dGTPase